MWRTVQGFEPRCGKPYGFSTYIQELGGKLVELIWNIFKTLRFELAGEYLHNLSCQLENDHLSFLNNPFPIQRLLVSITSRPDLR